MRLRSLSIVSALSLMTGCASSMQPVVVPRPALPANLTQPCPSIPLLPPHLTMGDLVIADAELAALYNECRARHKALVEAIK